MSEDRPIVAPLPVRNSDGTFTVTTSDAGDVRILCPSWCTVQHGYRYPPAQAEITHRSEPVWALADTPEHGPVSMVEVGLVQWPCSDRTQVFLSVETDDGHLEVGPTGSRRIAAALRSHADHILTMVGQLEAIRAEGP
ncbi:hypothetical protein OOK13_39190 [Streptomyces sp. NBC_00378]|uniref:DUF6907 domain-containing protein n=1 Tax=unclassified Streptomyces TaxID=2593676 RepID=UPI00225611ED|nr:MULTISPECIES: hypothetical protein [unclassified Streptomyces]MCX5114385.1 hypothetical protein [Streptomyces sp. NBC_00378]